VVRLGVRLLDECLDLVAAELSRIRCRRTAHDLRVFCTVVDTSRAKPHSVVGPCDLPHLIDERTSGAGAEDHSARPSTYAVMLLRDVDSPC
jgi:hypothetical protein